MDDLFTRPYMLLWVFVLAAMLFFPVRHLIWVLYVRRAEANGPTDDARKIALKRRAGVTSALLSFAFSFFYNTYLFMDR
jgi:hypothetical protein